MAEELSSWNWRANTMCYVMGGLCCSPSWNVTKSIAYTQDGLRSGKCIKFVASIRDVNSTTRSELQHWVYHDLERKAGLTDSERANLEALLRKRAEDHERAIQFLCGTGMLTLLPLSNDLASQWCKPLASLIDSEKDWINALKITGRQNANPPLPIEGILLTLRLGRKEKANSAIASVEKLLDELEEDSLCRYLVVLGIDHDERHSDATKALMTKLERRAATSAQLQSFHYIINQERIPGESFAICRVWDDMARIAWRNGADWVVLLGDDIRIECRYHYRAIYRSFLDIAQQLQVPFGFGCPWWNDLTFPGFPSFPCVGKAHFQIFGGLIPQHRRSQFVNQDLDPYLQRLYLKFHAAPCARHAKLSNTAGGNLGAANDTRYARVAATGWQNFVSKDLEPIRDYVHKESKIAITKEAIMVDVVVPSYRVRLDYLESICFLKVPDYMETLFIIIVDNPAILLKRTSALFGKPVSSLSQGERILEDHLSRTGNNVRVRCNVTNVGASASRNRGLDESAAEFILNLDDDLMPNPDLLEQYGQALKTMDDNVVGLVGLVRFPRSPTLPIKHAAVLMSYLTFMFEIAERSDMYKPHRAPAWGVTANILFRRTSVRFDLAYAKTGGGEDVDFSLNVTRASGNKHARLEAVPSAMVVHPFWPGSAWTLASHFFNWAIGDGALFSRFPEYRYWSFPNLPEFILLCFPWILCHFGMANAAFLLVCLIVADFLVDVFHLREFQHRCWVVRDTQSSEESSSRYKRSLGFYLVAHFLANLYVLALESGRLWGHFRRREFWLFRRFDWHIGQLPHAPPNFRLRECIKFLLFCGILAAVEILGFGNPI